MFLTNMVSLLKLVSMWESIFIGTSRSTIVEIFSGITRVICLNQVLGDIETIDETLENSKIFEKIFRFDTFLQLKFKKSFEFVYPDTREPPSTKKENFLKNRFFHQGKEIFLIVVFFICFLFCTVWCAVADLLFTKWFYSQPLLAIINFIVYFQNREISF
jgi:hypothetical protein